MCCMREERDGHNRRRIPHKTSLEMDSDAEQTRHLHTSTLPQPLDAITLPSSSSQRMRRSRESTSVQKRGMDERRHRRPPLAALAMPPVQPLPPPLAVVTPSSFQPAIPFFHSSFLIEGKHLTHSSCHCPPLLRFSLMAGAALFATIDR